MLKYPALESITLVDLDPEMTRQFATHPLLKSLNGGSLTSPKLKVVNSDAFPWLEASGEMFDFIAIDFPDPNNYSLGKLYSTAFYRLLSRHLADHGAAVVQSTSPMFARQSFWCIAETLKQAGLKTYPYHVYVPSFGEWGFILATHHPWELPTALPPGLKFLAVNGLPSLFEFPPDMAAVPVEPNRLNDQVLVRYYDSEWRQITR
jgi:spermidine synthase